MSNSLHIGFLHKFNIFTSHSKLGSLVLLSVQLSGGYFSCLPSYLSSKSFVLFPLPVSPRDRASACYRCSQAVGNSTTEPVIVRSALSGSRDLANGNAAQVRSLSRLIPWGLPVPAGVIVRSSSFVWPLPMTCLIPELWLARWLHGSHLTTPPPTKIRRDTYTSIY